MMKDWSWTGVRVVRESEQERRDEAEKVKDRNLESQTHCSGCGEADGYSDARNFSFQEALQLHGLSNSGKREVVNLIFIALAQVK